MDIIETKNENIIINHISLFDRHFMIAPVDCKVIDIQNIHIDNNDAERKRVTFQDIDGNIFSIDQIVNKLFSHMFIYGFLPSFIYKERCVVFSKVGDFLSGLSTMLLSLVTLSILAEVLFGVGVFGANVVTNVMELITMLGDGGFVGLIALLIFWSLFNKDK